MKPAYLAVCGHANVDIQLDVAEMPRAGASSPVSRRHTVYGGTACTIARHAAGLGVPTRLWARVGRDFPEDWRRGLEADGVDLSWLETDPDEGTPTCTILTDRAGEQAYAMDQGAMRNLERHPVPASVLHSLSGWLHLGTGDPAGYYAIAEQAHAAGIPVAFDPGQELRFMYDAKSFERLLDAADLFFCNEFELTVAFDLLGYGDPVQLLDHVDTVVVTRGKKGASLYRADGATVHQSTPPVDVVDPTGAGDALRAGWYAALHAGHDMATALRWGQAAAAACIQFQGPQGRTISRSELAV